MHRITSVSDLPSWFRDRKYKKRLSDLEWYRAIRARQSVAHLLSLRPKQEMQRADERLSELLLLCDSARPDSLIFWVSQFGCPIEDLTAAEATFLRFSSRQGEAAELMARYEDILALWTKVLDEDRRTTGDDPTPICGNYEWELANFVKQLDDENQSRIFDQPATDLSDSLGNPWLSYGRPLHGWPITVDTQFDDKTILKHFELWLKDRRRQEGEAARRPFNQNDFDDWEYYRIREIFDLETWAEINHVEILDRVIADAVWPHAPDSFSPIDVLRTTARKKVKEVFRFETAIRLHGQLQLEHGENFLSE